MRDLAIKNAKQGEHSCKESFGNSVNEIKDEILNKLNLLFPDCVIEFGEDEYSNSYPKRTFIIIDWSE